MKNKPLWVMKYVKGVGTCLVPGTQVRRKGRRVTVDVEGEISTTDIDFVTDREAGE